MLGQRIRRREDPRFLTGNGQYVDDLKLPGARHATFVRSYIGHARIRGIDTTEASALPGVQVFTAADVGLGRMGIPFPVPVDERVTRPYMAADRVRYVGEIVAVVLSDTREQGVDAAELVDVDYDPLAVVTDPAQALRDEVLLFDDVGTNVCLHHAPENPDPDLFADCEVTITGATNSQRLAVSPIEPRASAAQPQPDGTLTVWSSTQTPHQDRAGIAGALGLEPEQVRLIAPDVGGGFGGKGLSAEETIIAWLARDTGQTIRWTETRSENMVGMAHGRGQAVQFEIGGDREGHIKALRVKILQEAGAYAWVGAVLPSLTGMMSSGVYRIPKIEVEFSSVVTNTSPTGAYRGAGRPEATQFLERAIDQFAVELELDPAEIRRRNFISPDAFPYTTVTGAEYDCGDYGQALELALETAGYDDLRAEQAARRAAGDRNLLGIGLSTYVEVTNGTLESEFGEVEITADGSAILKTGSFSHGQGHETTFAQVVAEHLGLPVERVTVIKGDTAQVARGAGTYGSKSTQIGGVAAREAANEVVERGKKLAAEQLEADPHDMEFDLAGRPLPRGRRAPVGARVGPTGGGAAIPPAGSGSSPPVSTFSRRAPTFPFGAHVAVVEVDADTGSVTLKRLIAVDDAGRIINPMIADGQIHGGVASGIAQALHEEMAYDEDGNPLNANFVSYCIPGATEFPLFELVRMETPTPVNPLGAKGIGESGTIGSTPAVHNAVIDALAHLGVRHLDMPVNGERVWRAVAEAEQSGR